MFAAFLNVSKGRPSFLKDENKRNVKDNLNKDKTA